MVTWLMWESSNDVGPARPWGGIYQSFLLRSRIAQPWLERSDVTPRRIPRLPHLYSVNTLSPSLQHSRDAAVGKHARQYVAAATQRPGNSHPGPQAAVTMADVLTAAAVKNGMVRPWPSTRQCGAGCRVASLPCHQHSLARPGAFCTRPRGCLAAGC